jgi:hypothetical protein
MIDHVILKVSDLKSSKALAPVGQPEQTQGDFAGI